MVPGNSNTGHLVVKAKIIIKKNLLPTVCFLTKKRLGLTIYKDTAIHSPELDSASLAGELVGTPIIFT